LRKKLKSGSKYSTGLQVGPGQVEKIKYLNLKVSGKPVLQKMLLVSSFYLIRGKNLN